MVFAPEESYTYLSEGKNELILISGSMSYLVPAMFRGFGAFGEGSCPTDH